MNQTKKSFNYHFSRICKFKFLILCLSLLFLKCEKDVINKENKQVVNVEGNSLENHEFLVSEIGVDKIQENMKLTKRLKKLVTPKQKTSNNRTLNKTIYSSEYDFTINADYAKYIEKLFFTESAMFQKQFGFSLGRG